MTVTKERIAPGNNEIVLAQRVKVDPSVTELGDNAPVVALSLVQLLVSVTFLGFGAWVLIFGTGEAASEAHKIVKDIERWGIGSVLIIVSLLFAACSNTLDAQKRKENKALHTSIKGSRQVASQLGFPILTKDHVESRIRIEDTIREKRHGSDIKWSQEDSDHLATLLFQDLSREHAITSLINDRGMITAVEIDSALQEMQEESIKPIQDGWL